LPVILAGAAVIALVVFVSLATIGGSSMPATWANISTIWLVVPMMVVGVMFFLFTAGMIFLMSRLLRSIPRYTRLVQIYLQIFSLRFDSILDRITRPQITILSRWAAWREFWRKVWHIGRRA
jgi:hypothetical protein